MCLACFMPLTAQAVGTTKTFGGTGADGALGIAVDTSNNLYVTGYFTGTVDFDPVAAGGASDSHTATGGVDIFLSKRNPNGSYAWTKVFGGTGNDYGSRVAVDGSGNVYMVGYFTGTNVDFDPSVGVDPHTSLGQDGFLTKINADGSYGWTMTLGGNNPNGDSIQGVATDAAGNVFITGSFNGSNIDLDPTTGVDLHTSSGINTSFITRINADGSFAWCNSLTGTFYNPGSDITVDSAGNVVATGIMYGTNIDFDADPIVQDLHTTAYNGMYVTKVDANGAHIWSKTFSSGGNEGSYAVTTDSLNNVYISGLFRGTIDFNPPSGVTSTPVSGWGDIFLSKYSANGTYQWTKTIGATGHDNASGLAVDSNDNLYMSGYFANGSADFNATGVADVHTNAGLEDVFLTRYNADGSYAWSKTAGGTGNDYGGGAIAVDGYDNIVTIGRFSSTVDFDYDPTVANGDNRISAGGLDMFISSFDVALPTGSVSIDNGSAATNSLAVTLTLSCSDIGGSGCSQMQFSNDNVNWSALAANTTGTNHTIAAGADGIRTVYARFTDVDGNVSAVASDSITLDTTSPAAPTITVPVNNTITNNTARPTISGTAEADASVSVKDGATLLGLLTATGGSWTLASGAATLAAGVHSFTAIATDAAGNSSTTSTVITYTVDTSIPVVTVPASITTSAVNASGTPNTNTAIAAFLAAATANDNVDGTIIPMNNAPAIFPIGQTTVTFSAVDSAGNTGVNSAAVTVTALPPAGADLSIVKIASANPVNVGGLLIYTLTIANRGPLAASNIVVSDGLPTGVTLIRTSASQGSCTGTVNITCSLGTLANGATATVTLATTPTLAGVVTNVAAVNSPTPDPIILNNYSVLLTQVHAVAPVAGSPLALNASTFSTGASLTLAATVTPGPTPVAADVYLAIRFPDGSLFFRQADGSFSATIAPALVNWILAPVSGPVFNYTFIGTEPTGQYAWFLILTETGTANVIGQIYTAPFTFAP